MYCRDKPEARLYYHGALNDAVGIDIIDYAKRLKIMDRLIITDPNLTPAKGVPLEVLNWIYNSYDVQINTCLGEGFGLPNFEGAACGVPQVVPNWSATKELYGEDRGMLIDIDRPLLAMQQLNTVGGLIDVEDAVEKLNILHYHPEIKRRLAHNCFEYVNQPKFRWSNIAARFDRVFKEVYERTRGAVNLDLA